MDRNLFGEPGLQSGRVSGSSHKAGASNPVRSPVRTCARCGETYVHRKGENGTKYCADCQRTAYLASIQQWKDQRDDRRFTCVACDHEGPAHEFKVGARYLLCVTCWEKLKRVYRQLCAHHVPVELVRGLIADPSCPVCKVNVLEPQKNERSEWHIPMVVDHDHSCCPGSKSCGRCVRGLLCGGCNLAAGHVGHEARVAFALGEYLMGWGGDEMT